MNGLALWRTLNCQSALPTVAEDPSIGLAVAEEPSVESQECRVHHQLGTRDEKSQ